MQYANVSKDDAHVQIDKAESSLLELCRVAQSMLILVKHFESFLMVNIINDRKILIK